MTTTAAAATPPQPPHDTTTTHAPAPAPTDTAQIHTYHCLCTQLVLASTTPLSLLPRRGASSSSSDSAYILPLPGSPPTTTTTTTTAADDAQPDPSPHYALPLSLHPDRAPLVVQRPDGLEKRYCARCARCRVVVGYWLDWSQFAGGEAVGIEGNKARTGRRDDVVYVLPGGLLGTEEMAGGGRGEAEAEAEGRGEGSVV